MPNFLRRLRYELRQVTQAFRRHRRRSSAIACTQRRGTERLESRILLAADFGLVASFGDQPVPYGSTVNSITDVGGIAFFVATDLTRGTELWKSDGTAAGTVLVKDIVVGSGGSSPGNLMNLNGTLYFTANDGTSGVELWKSDGTAAGTVMVKDIQVGIGDAVPDSLRNVNGSLLFTATNGISGRELWKSNGTASGTVLVKDIRPGTSSSYPGSMTVVNGTLYFGANDGVNGSELWKSDGTEAGTVLVKDIFSGGSNTSFFYPGSLTNVNGTLYFSANDGTTGVELWKSNGTAAGTVLVKDIRTGGGNSSPFSLTNVNGTLLFSANDGTNGTELWKSDGTSAGTVLVKDIFAGVTDSSLTQLTAVNTTLFFRANDGTNGTELWKSDGTAAGTVLVKNINTGNLSSNPRLLVNVNGSLYFQALDSVSGNELWKSDGTVAGTLLVKDIVPGTGSSVVDSNSSSFQNPVSLVNVNGTAYFRATNNIIGEELWKSDGTETGTVLVRDIRTGNNDVSLLFPENLNGTFVFQTDNSQTGRDLWKSDGTTAGTSFLRHLQDPSFLAPVFSFQLNVNGTLYFNARNSAAGDELWKSDGTLSGTTLVRDIRPGSYSSVPSQLTNVSGTLLFVANDGSSGRELWKSNGTVSGTVLVKDIGPGSTGGSIGLLTSAGSSAYFVANDGTNGTELWKSDGTTSGTTLVKDIRPGSIGGSVSLLTSVGSVVFFVADDGVNGAELWKSDGTLAGTSLVKDIRPGSTGAAISSLTNVGGTAYFVADDGVNGAELWKSDGTLAGTSLVKDIRPGSTGAAISALTNVGGTVYFVADDGVNGAELWKSDGTATGTSLVKDVRPGSVGAAINSLTNANGMLYFSANDGVNGSELWQSDGTPSGTVLSFDFTGDSGSSNPRSMILKGDRLFVTATTELNGTGLYLQGPPNQAPENIVLDAGTVAENLPSGTVIGAFSSSDPDPGNTFNYTLTSGTDDTDNSSFEIVGNTLRTIASFNYEAKSTYSIRVRTTDQGGLSYEKSFLVTVLDVNETPVGLSLSNAFVSETARPGTTIGQLTTADPDIAGQFTYSFVAGSGAADNGLFQIIEDRLFTDLLLDADIQSSFSIRIRTTDSGNLFTEQSFTVTLKTGVATVVEDQIPGDGLNANQESTDPKDLINVSGVLYFVAEDGIHGRELWRMNSHGIAEIVRGPGGQAGIRPGHIGAEIGNLHNVNGTLYFTANDGVNGARWWRIGFDGAASMVENAAHGEGLQTGIDFYITEYVIELNSQVFLTAYSETSGHELWRINSSGFAALVENAVPGGGLRDAAGVGSHPQELTNVGGTLYFSARDENGRGQLWRLNTSGIAEIVNDNQPGVGFNGPDGSYVHSLFNHNGTLYFAANDGYFGTELFRVNSAGISERVEDSIPYFGINQFGNSDPQNLTSVGGTLFFTATDGINGRELWRVNGAGIAEMVDDAAAGTGIVSGTTSFGYEVADLTNFGGTLYFEANDGTNGRELWRVTETGVAQLVEDSTPGGGLNSNRSSYPSLLTECGGTLFFSAMDSSNTFQLWRINPAGTAEIVEDNIPGGGISSPSGGPQPLEMVNSGGSLYFHAFMNGGPYGGELWRVNGMGTAERVETLHGNPSGPKAIPGGRLLTPVNDTLYFSAFDPVNGRELWRLNETGMGELVEDGIPGDGINTTSAGSFPYYLTNINGVLYFTAYDSVNGDELRRINSSGVIELVEDAVPGGGIHPSGGSVAYNLTNVAGVLYFSADDGVNGQELWRINSAGLAEMVRTTSGSEIYPGSEGSYPEYLTNVNGTLYFQAQGGDGVGHELFRITSTGHAELVEDAVPGGGIRQQYGYGSFPEQLININGVLYFSADDDVNGEELWRVNALGIAELVEDVTPGGGVVPGSGSSQLQWLTNVNGTLYFSAIGELWRIESSGIAEMVEDDIAGGGLDNSAGRSYPGFMRVAGGTLYFQARDPLNGTELWRIRPDGIAEIVEDQVPGGGLHATGSSYPFEMTDVGGVIYFTATSSDDVSELWRINSSGIAEIVDDAVAGTGINASGNAYPTYLTNVNGVLYFIANDGVNGSELWRVNSSGIAELVEDEIPGGGIHPTGGSAPDDLVNIRGTLYFTANNGTHGKELWRINSAGTAEMVNGVADSGGIAPGSQGSYPYLLTHVNGTLYFSAHDGGLNGRELFMLPTNDAPTDLNLSSSQINENIPALTPLATFLTTDGNAGNTFQYSLVAGSGDTDNSQFQIIAGSLVSNTSLDFETRSSYSIRVRTTDQGGLWFEKAFTITVADQPEGTSGNDAFVLTYSSANVTVTHSTNNGPATSLGTFPLSAPLTVFGFGGTDSVKITGTVGNDVVQLTRAAVTVNGHDLTLDATESLVLAGGAGNDIYQFDADTSLGLVSLDETLGGIDTLDFALTSGNVAVNLGISTNQIINGNLTLNLKSTTAFENVTGGSGNDLLTGNSVSNILLGGAGNDVLSGGAGNDTITGGDGNDTLNGGLGADSIDGGGGNDSITIDNFDTSIIGGAGLDRVIVSGATQTAPVNLNLVSGAIETVIATTSTFNNTFDATGAGWNVAITGGSGNDTIIGGEGNDTLNGGLGADSINGGGDNDSITIDNFDTSIIGGAGLDRVIVSGATQTAPVNLNLVSGAIETVIATTSTFNNTFDATGAGWNVAITGGSGNETIIGGNADDTLNGGLGADLINGGGGNDSITIDNFDASVIGGSGLDRVIVSGATQTAPVILNLLSGAIETVIATTSTFNNTFDATGASWNVTITGGSGIDTIIGGNADDTLNGGLGADSINGGGGNDLIIIDNFDASVVGGSGLDRVLVSGATQTAPVTLNLLAAAIETVIASTSTFNNTFDATGASWNVAITGGSGNDTIIGGHGNDTLNGGMGADFIDGGGGNDSITIENFDTSVIGGSGLDRAIVSGATQAAPVILNLLAGEIETVIATTSTFNNTFDATGASWNVAITGGSGNDTIIGGNGNDTLNGNAGNDTIIGNGGSDRLFGGTGIDTVSYVTADSSVSVNLVTKKSSGGGGNDTLDAFENVTGSNVDDFIMGDANDNTLDGLDGLDAIFGGGGIDVILNA